MPTLKVKINGAWENVSSAPSGGGSGVTSWNELADKPFYEEGNSEVLFATQDVTDFAMHEVYGMYFKSILPAPFAFVIGETYRVHWNGVIYDCVAQDASTLIAGMIAIGNGTGFGLLGNDEPFAIGVTDSDINFFVLDPNDTRTQHNIGITYEATSIKALDAKYLPMDAIDARIEEYIRSALEGDY